MNDTTLDSLIVLRSLTADGVFSALAGLCRRGGDEALALFVGEVIAAGAERDLLGYAAERILCDENAFSVCCARGRHSRRACRVNLRFTTAYSLPSMHWSLWVKIQSHMQKHCMICTGLAF